MNIDPAGTAPPKANRLFPHQSLPRVGEVDHKVAAAQRLSLIRAPMRNSL